MYRLNRRGWDQKGQAMIIFALAATLIVGIAGLAIEGGLLEGDRRFDQSISDGAALAGAHKLPSDPSGAIQRAANYAVAGLNGGQLPAGCTPSASNNVEAALSSACDPSGGHSLLIQTPYNGQSRQILVRLRHSVALNLARVLGVVTSGTASRSVARSTVGGGPFDFAIYAAGNMVTNGNANTIVHGNVYVKGCIALNNSDNLYVYPVGSQVGSVEVYEDANVVPKTGAPYQIWNSGSSTGCSARVVGRDLGVDGSFNAGHGIDQFGAGNRPTTGTCAGNAQFSSGICPAGEVPFIGFPLYQPLDDTGLAGSACTDPGSVPVAWPFNVAGNVAVGGCYSACGPGGNLTIPDNTVFTSGIYAFVGNGAAGGCNVVFNGGATTNTSASANPLWSGMNGVTFLLYNGTSFCGSNCGTSNAKGTISLLAPSDTGDRNYGMLIYSCNSSDCASGGGSVELQGAAMDLTATGLIYNPGGLCSVNSNASELVLGQLICHDVALQTGASQPSGTGVTFGGGLLPTPILVASLIE